MSTQNPKLETHVHPRMRVRLSSKDPSFVSPLQEIRWQEIRMNALRNNRLLKETEPQVTSGDFAHHVNLMGEEPIPPPPLSPPVTTSREADGVLIPSRDQGKFCRFPHRAGKFQPFNQQVRGAKARAAIEALDAARKEEAGREAREEAAYEAEFDLEASQHWYPPSL